jgi:hypothetical protein
VTSERAQPKSTPLLSIFFVAVAVVLLVGATPRRAAAVWSTRGPDGGDVTALAIEPGAPAHVYAGTGSTASSGAGTPASRGSPRGTVSRTR